MTTECYKFLYVASALNKVIPMMKTVYGEDDSWNRLWTAYNLQQKYPGLYESGIYPGLIFLKEDEFIAVCLAFHIFSGEESVVIPDTDNEMLEFGVIFLDADKAYWTYDFEVQMFHGLYQEAEVAVFDFPRPRSGIIVGKSSTAEDIFDPYMLDPEFVIKIIENDLDDILSMLEEAE